jgi:hypothetical protein
MVRTIAIVTILSALAETAMAQEATDSGPVAYGRIEALVWWYNAPNGIPLLTTGDPVNDPQAGLLGGPSTRTLFGNRDVPLNPFCGARLTLGVWNAPRTFGIEAGFFALGRQDSCFSAAADGNGNPFLAVPFLSTGAGIENRFLLANPGGQDNPVNTTPGLGSYAAAFQSELAGADIDALANLAARPGFRIDLLGGFVWRGLYENLKLEYRLPETDGGFRFDGEEFIALPSFGGSAFDQFSTRNNFYGGQIGARTVWDFGRFSFDFTGKLGIGATVQQVTIQGQSQFTSTTPDRFQGPPTTTSRTNPFGVFAQTSNIGRSSQAVCALVPEFNTQVNFQALPRLKVFVGYNFMYWSSVVRPADQIDRGINRTNPADLSQYFTSLQGDSPALPPRPAPTMKTTDLLVQGINLGLEFQY